MQTMRSGFSTPPLTPFVKRLLIGLFAIYVALLIADRWLGFALSPLLMMIPGAPAPWQLVTYVVVGGGQPLMFLLGLVFLWWILSPFEIAMGPRRTMQLCLAVTLAGSVPAWLAGLMLPGAPPLFGTGPMWFGSMGATLWMYRGRQMSFFGLGTMTSQQFLALMLGLSALMFLSSKDYTHFIADLGALAGGIGFIRYLRRPPPRRGSPRPRPKRSARGSGLRVVEGGRSDEGGRPKWLN